MAYTQQIDSHHRGLILFLIDHSYSMSDPIAGSQSVAKVIAVSRTINRWLQRLTMQSSSGDGVRDAWDVGALGFATDEEGNPIVESAFAGKLAERKVWSIAELSENATLREEEFETFPSWVELIPTGGTPTCTAIHQAHMLIDSWIAEHPASFPPIVILITDGESQEGDPVPYAESLRYLSTDDGNLLLFTFSLASNSEERRPCTWFPDSAKADLNDWELELFSMASKMPSVLMEWTQRPDASPVQHEPHACALNLGSEELGQLVDSLFSFKELGTRPASNSGPHDFGRNESQNTSGEEAKTTALDPTPEQSAAAFGVARVALYEASKQVANLDIAATSIALKQLEEAAAAAIQAGDTSRWRTSHLKLNDLINELRVLPIAEDAHQLRQIVGQRVQELRHSLAREVAKGDLSAEWLAEFEADLSRAMIDIEGVDLGDAQQASVQLMTIARERICAMEQRLASATMAAANIDAKPASPDEPGVHEDPSRPPSPNESNIHENVQFTVYRPKAIVPEKWYDLLAYAHLDDKPDDAPAEELDPIEKVKQKAAQRLGPQIKSYKDTTQDSGEAIPQGGELTFVPEMDGVEFNPPRASIHFVESEQEIIFRLRTGAGHDGKTLRGRMSVFWGAILVADVVLRIKVDSSQKTFEPPAQEPMRRYRKIFASYSHQDLEIVGQFERFAEAMGDRYLRDWKDLRSGERWDERLLQMIEEADVFQLFWSEHAMRSPYCKTEWEYALKLCREGFIRPTYWQTPMPEDRAANLPPFDLSALHFTRLGGDATTPTDDSDVDSLKPFEDPDSLHDQIDSDAGSPMPDADDSHDDDLDLGDHSVSDELLLNSDSGINLQSSDSGLSLDDDQLDPGGSDTEALEMPEYADDDDESGDQVIALEGPSFDDPYESTLLDGGKPDPGFQQPDAEGPAPLVAEFDDMFSQPNEEMAPLGAPDDDIFSQPTSMPAAAQCSPAPQPQEKAPVWQIVLVVAIFLAIVGGFIAFILIAEANPADESSRVYRNYKALAQATKLLDRDSGEWSRDAVGGFARRDSLCRTISCRRQICSFRSPRLSSTQI